VTGVQTCALPIYRIGTLAQVKVTDVKTNSLYGELV